MYLHAIGTSDAGLLAFVKAEQFEFETFLIKGKCEKLGKRKFKKSWKNLKNVKNWLNRINT